MELTGLDQSTLSNAQRVGPSRAGAANKRQIDDSSRASILGTLNAFAIDVMAIRNADDLFWYVARNVVGKLNFVDCVIYQANPEQTTLQQVAALGEKNPYDRTIVNPLCIPFGEGITGRAAQMKKPIIVDDLLADNSYIHDTMAARSEICVPLISMGQVVGVIDSEHPEANAFGEPELEILTTIAAMTSAKLELLAEASRSNQRYHDLVNSHAQLAEEVNNRKSLEAQLLEARKLEAIGRLTGGFAHGFNNLLTVIAGNLELVDQSQMCPDAYECLLQARIAADRGADVIGNLLAFSQLSDLRPERIDLKRLVAKSCVHSAVAQHSLIALEMPDETWEVNADPAGTETAILNLILNAQDAMQADGTVHIGAANVSLSFEMQPELKIDLPPGRYVRLDVTDEGAGIADDTRQRIFDPFFSTKSTGIGSGLGLSMVQGFIKQSGGSVRACEAQPRGTTFELYFPAYG